MIEIYEGEVYATFVLDDDHVVTSVTGHQTLFNEYGIPQETSAALSYTETAGSGFKTLNINVLDMSSWPAPFRIEVSIVEGATPALIEETYSVVQPYVSVASIAASAGINMTNPSGEGYKSVSLVREMESVARHVINAFTGRSFGRLYASHAIPGTDTDRLFIDQQLAWCGAVAVEGGDLLYIDDGDATAEISPSGHILYVRDGDVALGFPEGYRYRVTGIFGTQEVPYDIQLACKILTIHYLCEDSAKQNQYIESIKFGESAMKSNRLAFAGTGLLAVDRLLEPYRIGKFRTI